MSIWLRYLAVICLVGNSFTVLWNLIALVGAIQIGALSETGGRVGFNLVISLAAVVLAALIAAPARRDIGVVTKVIAALSIVGGAIGVFSAAMLLYSRADQSRAGESTSTLAVAFDAFTVERSMQSAFFSACTLALAIAVIASRTSSGSSEPKK